MKVKDNEPIDGDIFEIIFDNKSITEYVTEYDEPMTLYYILDLALQNGFVKGAGTIIVIAESPLDGIVYKYGKHGDFWEEVGNTIGYA